MSRTDEDTGVADADVCDQEEQCSMRLANIERALAVHPRDPQLWVELAKAAWSAHDLETARGAWELAQVLTQRRSQPAKST